MSTRASIKGHPIHAMLIAVPIGLWIFSFAADIGYLITRDVSWAETAYRAMAGGVIGGLIAAIPGFIDYTGISDGRTRRVATVHMLLNIAVIGLYVANLAWRSYFGFSIWDVVLSVASLGLLSASGWLGGALVYEHGMGVDTGQQEQHPARRQAGRR